MCFGTICQNHGKNGSVCECCECKSTRSLVVRAGANEPARGSDSGMASRGNCLKRHLTCEMPASPTRTPATMVHAFSVSLFQAKSVPCADARWVPPAGGIQTTSWRARLSCTAQEQ